MHCGRLRTPFALWSLCCNKHTYACAYCLLFRLIRAPRMPFVSCSDTNRHTRGKLTCCCLQADMLSATIQEQMKRQEFADARGWEVQPHSSVHVFIMYGSMDRVSSTLLIHISCVHNVARQPRMQQQRLQHGKIPSRGVMLTEHRSTGLQWVLVLGDRERR
jgi:hypothetical protein